MRAFQLAEGFLPHFNFGTDRRIRSLFEEMAEARGKRGRADRYIQRRRLRQGKEKNKHGEAFDKKVSQLISFPFLERGRLSTVHFK